MIAAVLASAILVPHEKSFANDSLPIGGKGMYIWQLWNANGGGKNLNTIITTLKNNGITWIVAKMGDGDSFYNQSGKNLYNWAVLNCGSMDSVISLFHSNGIKVLAFQYVYAAPHHWGNTWSETDVANWILDIKGIDGLMIDAEIEYDTYASRVAAAQAYCDSIRAHHPSGFVGLTAWARINGHTTFPWTTFLDRVQVNMPQTYWGARPTTPQNEMNLMSTQFTSYTATWVSQGDSAAAKPIMPIGDGYSSVVAQNDITTFCNLSQSTYHYPGVSLWEYTQISHPYIWTEYAAAWNVTSVSPGEERPDRFTLEQNYPNPFNPSTTIRYAVSTPSRVTLTVFNILGQQTAQLVNSVQPAGSHETVWNANAASGLYFYRIDAVSIADPNQRFTQLKKMTLVK